MAVTMTSDLASPPNWETCTRECGPDRRPECAPVHAQTPPPSASGSSGRSLGPSVGKRQHCRDEISMNEN